MMTMTPPSTILVVGKDHNNNNNSSMNNKNSSSLTTPGRQAMTTIRLALLLACIPLFANLHGGAQLFTNVQDDISMAPRSHTTSRNLLELDPYDRPVSSSELSSLNRWKTFDDNEDASTSMDTTTMYDQHSMCIHHKQLGSNLISQHNDTVHDEIRRTIHRSIIFHQRGGSFQSVQTFLNRQIQDTLNRLDISHVAKKNVKYAPKTDQNSLDNKNSTSTPRKNQTVVEYLEGYYRTHEIPNGGVGQRMPIALKGTAARQVLYEKRWLDVHEPWNADRYQASIGPAVMVAGRNNDNNDDTERVDMTSVCAQSMCLSDHRCFCIPTSDNVDDAIKTTSRTIFGAVSHHLRGGVALPPRELEDEKSDHCHIISVASSATYDWTLEREFHKQQRHLDLKTPCHTHTFNCHQKMVPRDIARAAPNHTHFDPHCLSAAIAGATTTMGNDNLTSKHQPQQLKTYMELLQAASMPSSISPTLLHMDLEGMEYDVLLDMLSHTPSHLWPQQILLEVHFATRRVDADWMLRTRQSAELALFFGVLFNGGGYLPLRVHFKEGCPTCLDVLLLRIHPCG